MISKRRETPSFFLFSVLNIGLVLSQNSNAHWPEDKTRPFPYPTPDPININTFLTRDLKTPTPLTFNSDPIQKSTATNTGHSLLVTPAVSEKNEKAVLTGGILYKDVYKFFQAEYFWDLKLKPDTADRINGIGSPIQVVVSYFNTKYGSKKDAMSKRDGIAQLVVFVYVTSFTNIKLGIFRDQIRPIKKAGTSTTINELDSYAWYFKKSLKEDYYAYPGHYTDLETGKTYDSATVIVLVQSPPAYISKTQFNETFGSFENKDGKPYSHTSKLVPRGRRPVVHSKGLIMGVVKA